jgi:hypothetical protein
MLTEGDYIELVSVGTWECLQESAVSAAKRRENGGA